MSATPVERLNAALEGRYRIERELGEGGMATVYLADDLKHERKVALKVLKPELAAVVGAERFLAEIKTTANLQHPHILPLHDSGEAGGFLYYVMPYIEGESLRGRLEREKQLPVDEAVRIATDVAEALHSAHEQGVIHRDVKPANILLSKGRPLVADFGIALAVSAAGGGRLTETGLSMGTPYYMSPEQASADREPTPASDVYSLGCVLYEMLVGEPPYTGGSAQAVLAKILMGDAPTPAATRSSIPANVDAAIRKSLEKLPADRFAGVDDFARAVADSGFRHGDLAVAAVAVAPGPWKRLALGFGIVAVMSSSVAGWALLRPATSPVERFSLATDEGQLEREWLALSPDGSTLVMAHVLADGGLQLFRRRWDDLTASPIAGTEGRTGDPIISPDGQEVAFMGEGTQLMVASVQGGSVRTLADDAECCMRWGDDGFVYYRAASEGTIRRVPELGGQTEQVTTISGQGDGFHAYFQVLPESEVGVFTVFGPSPRIEAIDMSTGRRVLLTEGKRSWVTSSGHLVFASPDGRLMAARFDAREMELIGEPVRMVDGIAIAQGGGDAMYSLSQNGSLIY